MSYEEWIALGMEEGWCGPPVCHTHDGLPITEEEEVQLYDEGDDICIHIVRMYENFEIRDEVEKNHSASVWRKPRL